MALPRVSVAVLLSGVVIVVLLLGWSVWRGGRLAEMLGWQDPPHVSDRDLIEKFHHHQAEFESLRQMITQDVGLVAVDAHRTWPEDSGSIGVSPSRIAEYRRLLKEVGVRGRIAISKDRTVVEITSSARGFATHNSQKGYLYATAPRVNGLVSELDSLSSRGVGSGVRPIADGRWYLFFEGY